MKIEELSQQEIALLRIIYMAPGLEQRVYGLKATLAPLANGGLINGTTSMISLTPFGLAFLKKHKLDHFGYEKARHSNEYPAQVSNNKALAEAMASFTGSYLF